MHTTALLELNEMRDEDRVGKRSALGESFDERRLGDKRLGKFFYLFAALQLVLVVVGATGGLLVAPASLFVSRTEEQAFGWIVIGLLALITGTLAVITLPLAIIAGIGIGKAKRWGRITAIVAAIIALLEFPLGTAFGIYALKNLLKKRLP